MDVAVGINQSYMVSRLPQIAARLINAKAAMNKV